MSNSVANIRKIFVDAGTPLTLPEINAIRPELLPSQISMALCYLMKQRYVTREQIPNQNKRGRKNVWSYTYHEVRLPENEQQAVPELSAG